MPIGAAAADSNASRPERPRPGTLSRDGTRTLALAAAWVAAIAVLLLTRPYRGIVHDGVIYMGRILADRAPATVGRDILFGLDGQSAFSLFPRLLGAAVERIGPESAAFAGAAIGLAAWFAAVCALASRFVPRPALLPAIVAVLVLPPFYGAFEVIRYGESFLTPRPAAEALVLGALAARLAGQPLVAFGLLGPAILLHPIMALPGLAVLVLLDAVRRPRPAAAIAAMIGAGLAFASVLGLPLADRLRVIVDPAWDEGLRANAYLFPTLWPVATWVPIATKFAILAGGWRALPPSSRPMAGAIAAVAGAGIVATALFGDLVPVALVAQVQPWRACWLLGVAAALVLPVIVIAAWHGGGGSDRLAASALCLAVLAGTEPLALCFAAAAVWLAAARNRDIGGPLLVRAAAATAGGLGILYAGIRAVAAANLAVTAPPDAGSVVEIWGLWLPVLAAVTVLACCRYRVGTRTATAAAAGAICLLGAGAARWDDRPALQTRLDRGGTDAALVAALPPEPGTVLWLRSVPSTLWVLADRPSWISYVQGAGMVFSRPLAIVWTDRMARLMAAGLAGPSDRVPLERLPGGILRPTPEQLAAFCRAPDAPVAIVLPQGGDIVLPAGTVGRTYRLPHPVYGVDGDRGGLPAWTAHDAFTVVHCTELAGGIPAREGGLRPSLGAG